jgi:hypothetical protein
MQLNSLQLRHYIKKYALIAVFVWTAVLLLTKNILTILSCRQRCSSDITTAFIGYGNRLLPCEA